jgi:acetyl esterase/lipase
MYPGVLQRMNFIRLIGVLSVLLLNSCDALEPESREYVSRINEPIVRYREQRDVSYGKNQYQNFDIYYPENSYRKPSEVVILLHGGGWTFGEKWFLQPSVNELLKARKNLTIVNINYRLIPEDRTKNLYEHQIADIDSCVNFLRRNMARYNIRDDKFAILGASAGGHLSLSYAYTLGKSKIHTVIGMSAITELSSARELITPDLWGNIKSLTGYTEGSSNTEILAKCSPVYLASVESPRTILLYGLKDDAVTLRQQTLLRERLLALRVPNTLYAYDDQTHNVSEVHVAEGILAALGADEYDLYFTGE